jgi:hypothetical protein
MSQCASGWCWTEASAGYPNGMCTTKDVCTVGTTTGCNGGMCYRNGQYTDCAMPCTGTGTGTTGRCRDGYACFDPDNNSGNNNGVCVPLCTSDAQCAGMGTDYGCNVYTKTCMKKTEAIGGYGAACTTQNEDGVCKSHTCSGTLPGGYCTGVCTAQSGCGPGGTCLSDSNSDAIGICMQTCTATTNCRGAPYKCWELQTGAKICDCLRKGESCSVNADCCSNKCSGDIFSGFKCE